MSETVNDPVIILGVPRSGTTLLRVLLNSHPDILGAPETAWITGGYGDFSIRQLIESLIKSEIGAVKNLEGVDETLVIESSRGFLRSIFNGYLERSGKKMLVLKTPDDVGYIDLLNKLFPDARYIHIYRDGRDVACSTFRQKGQKFGDNILKEYGELTVINALKRWVSWENRIRAYLEDEDKESISLSYEQLVTRPATELKKVCKFLRVKYDSNMIDYKRHNHALPKWEAGSQDVMMHNKIDTKSIGVWKREMLIGDRVDAEIVAGRLLDRIGYATENDGLKDMEKHLYAEVNELQRQLSDSSLKLEELEEIINGQVQQINIYEQDSEQISEQHNLVKEQSRIIDLLNEEVTRLSGESNRLKSISEESQIQCKKTDASMAELNKWVDSQESELELLRSSRSEYEKRIALKEKVIESLESRLSEMYIEAEDSRDTVDQLRKKIKNNNIEMESMMHKAIDIEEGYVEKLDNLEKINRDLRMDNEQSQKQNQLLLSEKSEMCHEIEKLEKLNNDLGTDNEKLHKQKQSLLSKKSEMCHEIGRLEKLNNDLGIDNEKLHKQNQLLLSEKSEMRLEIENLITKHENTKRQMSYHEADAAQKLKMIDELHLQLNRSLKKKHDLEAEKHLALQDLTRTTTFRVGKAIVSPAHYSKRAIKWLRKSKNITEHPSDVARKVHIDLKDQLTLYYGNHRSGWSYAVSQMAPLNTSSGVYLDTFIERTFVWKRGIIEPIKQPWVGFIHVPPGVPEWFQSKQSNAAVFASDAWKESYPYCKGLFTLSAYHKRELEKILDVPINAILHPTAIDVMKWDMNKFQANSNKRIVQVGWWLRKLHAIYELPLSDYTKTLLRVNKDDYLKKLFAAEKDIHVKKGIFNESMYETAEVLDYLPDGEYDNLLAENIVFIDLYDSSANNAIIECMARNTPILINPLPPVMEYLGEEYPFYYNSYEEAIDKASNHNIVNMAHEYLKASPIKSNLTGDYFRHSIISSDVMQALTD